MTTETAERLQAALTRDQRSLEGHVQSQEEGGIVLEVPTTLRQVAFYRLLSAIPHPILPSTRTGTSITAGIARGRVERD